MKVPNLLSGCVFRLNFYSWDYLFSE